MKVKKSTPKWENLKRYGLGQLIIIVVKIFIVTFAYTRNRGE